MRGIKAVTVDNVLSALSIGAVTAAAVLALSACGEGDTFGPEDVADQCTPVAPCVIGGENADYGWSTSQVKLPDGRTVLCIVYRYGANPAMSCDWTAAR